LIAFNEEKHQYLRGDDEYISVTTLIKKYEPPFQKEYWSMYKAIKAVFEKHGKFTEYKWACGGWENVVGVYKTTKDGHKLFYVEVMEHQQKLLADWEEQGHVARVKGTKVHKDLEDEVNNASSINVEGDILIPTPGAKAYDPISLDKNIVMTEVIIFNDRYQVAGMVDRVDKKDKVLNIIDHKTSKQITKIPFRDETMYDPIQHIPNANYYEYSLQMSLYAWMLEQFGYEIGKLSIEHRNRDSGKLIEIYPVNYLKTEIELILVHHAEGKKL
jgi:hypothetical protein